MGNEVNQSHLNAIFGCVFGNYSKNTLESKLIDIDVKNFEKLIRVQDLFRRCSQLQTQKNEEYLWGNQYGLVIFLLLTTFDLLGQEDDHMDFLSWIKSNKNKLEKEEIVKNLGDNYEPIKVAGHIFEGYNNKYGVTKSFFNFINKLISSEIKTELLDSVRFNYTNHFTNQYNYNKDDEIKIIKLIYQLRNDFTHKLINAKGSPYSFSESINKNIMNTNTKAIGMFGTYQELQLIGWPFLLMKVIINGLCNFINSIGNISEFKETPYFELDPSEFIPFQTQPWKIYFNDYSSLYDFYKCINEAFFRLLPKRTIYPTSYGIDYDFRDIENDNPLAKLLEISKSNFEESKKYTLESIGFKKNKIYKIIDKYESFAFSQIPRVKHIMIINKNSEIMPAELYSDGSVRGFSKFRKNYIEDIQNNRINDIYFNDIE